jgi:hypothetical protein
MPFVTDDSFEPSSDCKFTKSLQEGADHTAACDLQHIKPEINIAKTYSQSARRLCLKLE